MGTTLEATALETTRGYWLRKAQAKADNARQTSRVASLIRSRIYPTDFYESALDLGCGRGRFLPILSSFCGHIWAVDIVSELLCDIEFRAKSATAFCIEDEFKLPKGPHDFLWCSFFLQHLTDAVQLHDVCNEVRKVMKPGARVILLENAKDNAPHVRAWKPNDFAMGLGLSDYSAHLVTVNDRSNDHWWIEGRIK